MSPKVFCPAGQIVTHCLELLSAKLYGAPQFDLFTHKRVNGFPYYVSVMQTLLHKYVLDPSPVTSPK
jgi:hypothetical protein